MLKTNFVQLIALSETTQKDRLFKEGHDLQDDMKEHILKVKVSDIIDIPEEQINELTHCTDAGTFLTSINTGSKYFSIAREILKSIMPTIYKSDINDIFSEIVNSESLEEINRNYVETRIILNFVPVQYVQWFHTSLSKVLGESKERSMKSNSTQSKKNTEVSKRKLLPQDEAMETMNTFTISLVNKSDEHSAKGIIEVSEKGIFI